MFIFLLEVSNSCKMFVVLTISLNIWLKQCMQMTFANEDKTIFAHFIYIYFDISTFLQLLCIINKYIRTYLLQIMRYYFAQKDFTSLQYVHMQTKKRKGRQDLINSNNRLHVGKDQSSYNFVLYKMSKIIHQITFIFNMIGIPFSYRYIQVLGLFL